MASLLECVKKGLLARCFEHFVPDPLPTVGPNMLDKQNREKQKNLVNLCSTSRVWKKVAQALLYRNVVINDGDQLMCLFASLLNNKNLRLMIRSLSCPLNLCCEGNEGQESVAGAIIKIENELGRKEQDVLQSSGLRLIPVSIGFVEVRAESKYKPIPMTGEGEGGSLTIAATEEVFLQGLVVAILLMARNVEDILLSAPLLASRKMYSWSLVQAINRDWVPSDAADESLHMVKKMRFRGDISQIFKPNGFAELGGINPALIPPLTLGQTESLELLGDSGDWDDLIDVCLFESSDLSACLRHLTDLKLFHSRTASFPLRCIFEECYDLKSLTYTTRAQEWMATDTEFQFPDVEGALLTLASQLEKLHYEALTRTLPAGYHDADAENDLSEHIFSLSLFPKLKDLTIDICSLLGPSFWDPIEGDSREHRISTFLPPNIETLVITERYSEAKLRDFRTSPNEMLDHDLSLVQRIVHLRNDLGTLERLRKVVLRLTPIYARRETAEDAEIPEAGQLTLAGSRWGVGIFIRVLKATFRHKGVALSVERAQTIRCEDGGENHGLYTAL